MRSRMGYALIITLTLFGCTHQPEVVTLKCPPVLPTLDACHACKPVEDDDAAWSVEGLRYPRLRAFYLRERAARIECVTTNNACIEQGQARREAWENCD